MTSGLSMTVASFELNFRPNVELVSVVRRFVSEFYQRFLNDPDGTSRVALATHELLENAVKYSRDGETTIRIEVEPSVPARVRIRLQNRASPKDIAAIREILDGIARAEDAITFYNELIVRTARTRVGSGLGLARICAEGEMEVTYKILEGDMTVIEATTSVRDAA